jgi:Family of unknown function (DUF6101)
MEAGRLAAGSGRIGEADRASAMAAPLRLDPFSLPVRFTAPDDSADERLRVVDLHRERVVLRRSVGGMRMALNLPVAAFRGVAIRLNSGEAGAALSGISVVLEHCDPALCLPLFSAPESDEIVAEWQSWARVLGLPLLVAEADGTLREPFAQMGVVRIEPPTARRRRRSALARRRPARLMRRTVGAWPAVPIAHHGEREIIAPE